MLDRKIGHSMTMHRDTWHGLMLVQNTGFSLFFLFLGDSLIVGREICGRKTMHRDTGHSLMLVQNAGFSLFRFFWGQPNVGQGDL